MLHIIVPITLVSGVIRVAHMSLAFAPVVHELTDVLETLTLLPPEILTRAVTFVVQVPAMVAFVCVVLVVSILFFRLAGLGDLPDRDLVSAAFVL